MREFGDDTVQVQLVAGCINRVWLSWADADADADANVNVGEQQARRVRVEVGA